MPARLSLKVAGLSASLDPGWAIKRSISDGRTFPSEWYSDDSVFFLEQKLIFSRSWDYVGHRGQLAKPGDFLTSVTAGVPVVVICGKDGKVRAFLNRCRHRNAPVAIGSGNAPLLVCSYHAWSYNLDGSLKAAPRSREDPTFCSAALGLSPIAIDTLGDMVFVNLDGDALPLLNVLDPIPEIAMKYDVPLGTAKFREIRNLDIDANWKIVWDNNSECYHCPTIHNAWFKEADLGPDAISSFPIGSFHFQHTMDTRSDSPIDNHFFCWPTFTLATDSSSGPGFGQGGSRSAALQAGHLGYFLWRWIPISARRTRIELHLFSASDLDQAVVDEWFDALLQVLNEDKEICERVQSSHECGMGEAGTLIKTIDSEYQTLVWQRLVYRALTEPHTSLYAPLLDPSATWPVAAKIRTG